MHRRALLLSSAAIGVRPAHALYDPKPIAVLELATGTWVGSLTYRDYQKPDRLVTLKTVMIVSLATPDELTLYYVFDDGPSKTVYSYEKMKFELTSNQVVWNSGTDKPTRSDFKITSSTVSNGKCSVAFEKRAESKIDRYLLEISKATWTLAKHELDAGGVEILRSRYEFVKLSNGGDR
jgi:hypothetical protein